MMRTDFSNHFLTITRQDGPVPAAGVNGVQPEDVLEVVAARLRALNAVVPSRETSLAITKVQEVIFWLAERTRDRVARSVEGTTAP